MKANTTIVVEECKQSIGGSMRSLAASENAAEYNVNENIGNPTLSDLWRDYTSTATLHCLARADNPHSSKLRRLFWYVFLASMIALVGWQSSIQILRYLKHATLMQEYSVYDEAMDFPSVTICDMNQVRKSDVPDPHIQQVLQKTYMENRIDQSYFDSLDKEWIESINVHDVFYKRYNSSLAMLLSCVWGGEAVPCTAFFHTRVTHVGVCATLVHRSLSENAGIGRGNGLTVILHTNTSDYLVSSGSGAGFWVSVHTKDEEDDVEKSGIALSPGTANILSLRKSQISFLKYPTRAFGDDYCVDTTAADHVHPLTFIGHYSYGECRLDCITRYMTETCGCRGVFMPGQTSICDLYQMVSCYKVAEAWFISNSTCDCNLPCESTSFITTLSQSSFPYDGFLEAAYPDINVSTAYMRNNGLLLEVFLENKMTIDKTQILEFTDSDLVAAIGGYMGLFIGASFGTIMETLEFLFNVLLKTIKTLKSKRNK